jgi:hypothetical protein
MKVTTRTVLLVAFGLLADGLCMARDSDQREPQAIRLNAEVRSSNDGKSQLAFDLEYIGHKPARIFESNLPWGIRQSLLLVAICLDGKRSPIEELEYIDDPTPNVVSLQPGQRAHGSIDLSDRFPKLDECLAKRDSVIFWSYQFVPVDGGPSARINGGVQINKR